jgi:hypothetical protein
LKVPFARPCRFYENLKDRHLPQIGTIGARICPRLRCASLVARALDARNGAAIAPTPRRRHARERIVHHATDRSPFNSPFTILCEWTRALMQILRLGTRKYHRPACLSVRLSGV